MARTFPSPFACRHLPALVACFFCSYPFSRAESLGLPRLTNSLGIVLVQIPAGEFLMGSPKDYADAVARKVTSDWYRDSAPSEWPQRRVKISRPFWMGIHEVTLRDFGRFVEATHYRTDAERDGRGAAGRQEGKWVEQSPTFNWRTMGFERATDEPVLNITWNDAHAFCAWLSRHEGARYRLPTEAEWEYACRAGTTTPFYWGDDESRRNDFVWSGGNSGGRPHPVGRLKPNAWGLFDMNGNAYEYCADGWSTNVTQALVGLDAAGIWTDPQVSSTPAGDIVVRGASWGTAPIHCRSAFRGSAGKTHRNQRDGFRVVRETVP